MPQPSPAPRLAASPASRASPPAEVVSLAADFAISERLRGAGLRATRRRRALAALLFSGPDRHVTAESLHGDARKAGINVSLATVYNTLHQFTDAGLLAKVMVDGSRLYFDTNLTEHHHFFCAQTNSLLDIDGANVTVSGLPSAPDGTRVERVDVIVRLNATPSDPARPAGTDQTAESRVL